MCQQHAARNHAQRLANFLHSSAADAFSVAADQPTRQSLWYQEPLGPGQPPKSHWFIRKLLERIRTAVRG